MQEIDQGFQSYHSFTSQESQADNKKNDPSYEIGNSHIITDISLSPNTSRVQTYILNTRPVNIQ